MNWAAIGRQMQRTRASSSCSSSSAYMAIAPGVASGTLVSARPLRGVMQGVVGGHRIDKESNVIYNYFRDYDQATGRYIESDPVGLRGGLNSYAYVSNAPLAATDALGLTELMLLIADRVAGIPEGRSGDQYKLGWPTLSLPPPGCKGTWESLIEIMAPGKAATFFCRCRWVCRNCDGEYTGITFDNYGVPVEQNFGRPSAKFERDGGGIAQQRIKPGAPTGCACTWPKAEPCICTGR
ncbi:MAG TPA: RHS repeat-associated core domain-containing protein [Burkholderiales bacterium]|nr:RHS repeat-associated core domain-containing protein [Burkholderiales bacterium]